MENLEEFISRTMAERKRLQAEWAEQDKEEAEFEKEIERKLRGE